MLGFEDLDLDRVIQQIKPDVVVVGYDQDGIKAQVEKIRKGRGLDFKIVQIERFGPEDLNSSSKIKSRIVEGARRKP